MEAMYGLYMYLLIQSVWIHFQVSNPFFFQWDSFYDTLFASKNKTAIQQWELFLKQGIFS